MLNVELSGVVPSTPLIDERALFIASECYKWEWEDGSGVYIARACFDSRTRWRTEPEFHFLQTRIALATADVGDRLGARRHRCSLVASRQKVGCPHLPAGVRRRRGQHHKRWQIAVLRS